MSNAVAKVVFLQGQAWAKAPDGTMRALTVGSTLNDDEILMTGVGSKVELDSGNGEPLVINGGLSVGMSRDLFAATATEPDEALLSDASVQEALTVLEQGGDLLDELEETAAGNSGGSGSDGGSSFVRLTRLMESTDAQSFEYDRAAAITRDVGLNDGEFVNRAPVVTDQTLTTNEDEAFSGQIIAQDIEGDALTFTLSTAPTNGVVVLDPVTGQFTFTPNANYNGPESFVVTVTDSRGNATDTRITFNVTPVNDAPTANDVALTTDEDVAVSGQVVAQDVEGDVLTYTITGNPANGTVVLNAATGAFVYTPNTNYNGNDSFTVTISDGNGGTTTSTVTVGVAAVNDLPVAQDLSLTTDEDVAVNGQIVATDIDGDTLGYAVTTGPTNGSVVLNAATGAFVYTPNTNYNGNDSFTVTISDGNGGTTTSTVTVGVNPLNDAPVAADLSLTTDEDVAVNGQISASDIDGDILGYTVSSNPANGTVVLNAATGAFIYTPNTNFNGNDSFEVTISDGKGGTTTSTVTVGVNPVNDAPVATDLSLTTDEEVAVNGQISASDIDGDILGYTVSSNPTNGTVVLNASTGAFVYTPNSNYNGNDSFTVTISDGNGGTTTSTVNIGVNPVNDAPIALDDTATTDENTAVTIVVRANDTDIDGDLLTVTGVTQGANGSVVIDTITKNPIYTPNSGFSGTDTFTYTVEDGQGGSATATVTVTVNPVNDVPVLVITQVNDFVEDAGAAVGDVVATFTTSDADGDIVTVTLSDTVNYVLSGNTVVLTAAGLALVNSGADLPTFSLTPNDGTVNGAAVSANPSVTPANDAPVLVITQVNDFVEDAGAAVGGVVATFTTSDADNDTVTVTLSDTVNYALVGSTVVLTAAGLALVNSGADLPTFSLTPNDGTVNGASVSANPSVTPANDAPVLVITQVNDFVEDAGAAVGDVVATFTTSDADGDIVTVTLSDTVNYVLSGNTVVLTAAGLALVNSGADLPAFSLTPNDGTVNGASVSANPSVTPANDAPVLVITQVNNFVEDAGAAVGDVVATFTTSDADNDTVTVTLSDTVNYALSGNTVVLTAAGLALVNSGADLPAFTLTPSDGTVNGASVSANPSVTPANDAPVLVITQVNNFVEDAGAAVGDVVATFTTSDADNDTVTVTLSDTVNYALSGNTVVLTAAGLALVNSGADLPTFSLTPNDGTVNGAAVSANPSVTPANDAPVLVITQVNDFVEDAGAAVGDVVATFTTSDADNDAVTVTLSDTVNYALVGNTVVLTAAGLALVNSGADLPTFSLTPNDGTVNGAAVSANPSVTPANDAPVLVITQVNNFVEDAGAAVGDVVATFTTSDADNDTVTVTLSDTVNYALVGNTVVLTAAGLALVNSGADLPTFSLTPNDGTVNGAAVSANPSVTPANDAPVLTITQVNNFVEDAGAAVGDVVATFTTSDADNDTVTVTLSDTVNYALSGNTVVLTAAGLALVNSGADLPTFTLTPNDGTVNGASVSANPSVTPANDAPVLIITQVNNFVEDAGAAVGDVVATFTTSDADNDTVTVTLSDTVNYALVGNTVVLTAAGLALVNSGADLPSFTLTPNDGTVNGAAVSANPSVTAVNDVPVAVADSIIVAEGGTATVLVGGATSVLANDSDAENTALTAILVTGPTHGTLTLNTDGTFSYVHNGSETMTDSFRYKVNDGTADGNTVTVNIKVTPVNDAPISVADSIEVAEGGTTTVLVSGATSVLANDTDAEGNSLSAVLVSGPTEGTLTLNANGTFSYTHNGGEITTDSFTYRANDGTVNGNLTTVTIKVIPVNDLPVANDDTASVNQGAVLTLTAAQLLGNDTDPDGDTLSITSVQGASNGTVSLVGGNVIFTPNPSFYGSTSFTYTISDGHASSTATVNVNVVKTNNDPVANTDSAAASNTGLFSEYFGYREGPDGLNLTNIAQVNSFINGRTADATFVAKTFDYGNAPAFSNGLGSQGNLRAFLGSDAATMGTTDPATTTDAIVRMRGFVALEAGTYNFKVTADDGYQIKVDGVVVAVVDKNQAITATSHPSFTLTSSGLHTVEVLYWDQANYARLKLELSSDSGTTYNSLGNFPVYQSASLVALEDRALTIPVSSLLTNDTDADNDTLSVTSVQGATNGTVSLAGGIVTFTPIANYSGAASFSYTISDGKGGTSTATVNLTIAPVNDAPVAVNDSIITKTNTATTVKSATLLLNDNDIDSSAGSLKVVSVQNAVNGTVSMVNDNITFTPVANFEGIGSFTYTVRDNFGATSTATVNVAIGAASVPSVVVAKTLLAIAHGDAGTSVKFPITTQLVDTDGSESLSIKVSGVPTGLTFNAGTNLGGGVWAFTEADLPNLVLNIPGGYSTSTSGTSLTVQVTSTEMYGGYTASVSSALTLHAYKTTIDKTTTISANLTGTNDSEYITGDDRDNVINGGNGNDVIYGGAGNDTLSATAGSNIFYGDAGNDVINGGSGIDYIYGGAGNDTMSGGSGNVIDVFAWTLGDQGAAGAPAVDTINNFATAAAGNNHTGGDVLDLRDLLQGEHVGPNNAAGNLADYLHFEVAGGTTTIHISHTGGFAADSHSVNAAYTSSAETQKIVLNNVDLQSVYSGATTDQQIITQLLNNNKLITD